jgi:hypothetical protein
MKIYYEGYPFSPRSGKIMEETATRRLERYFRNNDFTGEYFDIEFGKNAEGLDISFSITIYPAYD